MMPEHVVSDKTLDERYGHPPGGFNAVIDSFEIPGEPSLSILIRRVCRDRTVWPEQLLGYARARSFQAAEPGHVPASTGRCDSPLLGNRAVTARRLIWRAAYVMTDLSIENIAELFGYSPGTIRPWATSWRLFEKDDPEWWRFWGPSLADLIGVPLNDGVALILEASTRLREATRKEVA